MAQEMTINDLGEMMSKMQGDMGKMQGDIGKMQGDITKMQQDITDIKGTMATKEFVGDVVDDAVEGLAILVANTTGKIEEKMATKHHVALVFESVDHVQELLKGKTDVSDHLELERRVDVLEKTLEVG